MCERIKWLFKWYGQTMALQCCGTLGMAATCWTSKSCLKLLLVELRPKMLFPRSQARSHESELENTKSFYSKTPRPANTPEYIHIEKLSCIGLSKKVRHFFHRFHRFTTLEYFGCLCSRNPLCSLSNGANISEPRPSSANSPNAQARINRAQLVTLAEFAWQNQQTKSIY